MSKKHVLDKKHIQKDIEAVVEQVRPRIIGIAYWGSGVVLFSVMLLLLKGLVLHSIGVVYGDTLWEKIQRFIAWGGNDLLYCFLIWIFAAVAMNIGYRPLKAAAVIVTCVLLYMYAADVFALVNFHSRFSFSAFGFFSWENTGPYLWYGIGATILWIMGLIGSVYVMYFFSKLIPEKYYIHLIRSLLVVAVGVLFTSFFVKQVNAYQQNIIQIDFSGDDWSNNNKTKPYEQYYRGFKGENQKPNIILVFAESFSSIDSQLAGGSKNLLPGFDAIAKDGIFYSNFIANGCTSDSAHIASLQGVEPWQTKQLDQNYNRYKSYTLGLPAFLSQQGYQTHFVSTVSLNFLQEKQFLTSLQFDDIIGDEGFKSWKKYVFRAAPDEALYSKVESMLQQEKTDDPKPQFIALQTISSHKPYDAPTGSTEEAAFRYADDQLLAFYHKLQDNHYFDNGILIVVGDHRKMQVMGYDEIEKWGNAAYGKALMAVVGKGIPKGKVITTPVQHWDIFSSLKQLTASGSVNLHEYYNDIFGNYVGRTAAIRYCQFVDKQYVATRADGTTWTITPKQHNSLAAYIRSYYQFQQGINYDVASVNTGVMTTGSSISEKLANYPGLMRIAHQGITDNAPPNSLDAFIVAKNKSIEGIEMDVSFTKDGYPVVVHGPDLGRIKCTEGIGKKLVSDFDLQEMKDACTLYNGQIILTLQEVLEKTPNAFLWYFIDVKIHQPEQRNYVNAMLQSIKKLNLNDKLMFSSTDEETNLILNQTNSIVAGWEVFDEDTFNHVLEQKGKFILIGSSLITPDIVEKAKSKKKEIVAYTVNDTSTMTQLYDWGVRFFITDKPVKILD